MACCDGSNDQDNRNQKKKYQKEKYDPLRRVNPGMTKISVVQHVASNHGVTQKHVRDIFQTLKDRATRELEENGTSTIPDMVRIFMQTTTRAHLGKVLKCEPVGVSGGWASTVARRRAHTVENVDSAMKEDVD